MGMVHYRTGSLENLFYLPQLRRPVHYRTGSLEIVIKIVYFFIAVHYRTGSLEIYDYIVPERKLLFSATLQPNYLRTC